MNHNNAMELADQIISFYKKRGVPLDICRWDSAIQGKQCKFRIITKKGTRIDLIRKYAKDAQFYLELPLLQVEEDGAELYIVALRKLPRKNKLLRIMDSSEFDDAKEKLEVVHPVGIDIMGNPVLSDLTRYPHAMVVGTTRSGKSVALKCLILSLVLTYSPRRINILIGDGASDLQQFSAIPHLSYPIITNNDDFFNVVLVLKDEMERRMRIKNTAEFSKLSTIIFIIDEFNSFINGNSDDKRKSKVLIETITEILRRGRHARIHIVLAAHNPTKQNIKIDMGDIPVKLVFRVANLQNSVTVLGASGAEKLRGEGDMFFYQNGESKRLLGTYISDEDIESLLKKWKKNNAANNVLFQQHLVLHRDRNLFKINEDSIRMKMAEYEDNCMISPVTRYSKFDSSRRELLFANIILWTLGQTSVSCNRLCENFKIGWSKANSFLGMMQDIGIVDGLDAKLPRTVLLNSVEEVPEKVVDILQNNGFSIEDISGAMVGKA